MTLIMLLSIFVKMKSKNYNLAIRISNPLHAVHLIWGGPESAGMPNTWVIYLDSHNQVIVVKLLASGKAGRAIPLRRLVEPAIIYGASRIILLNQRVSPSPVPWEKDWRDMIEIKEKLESIQIKLMDQIIIGRDRFFSMAAGVIYECK